MKSLLITIDGPAGAGKTTVSRSLAKKLGYRYVDTGALYRGIAFEAKSKGLSHDDDAGLEILCASLDLKFIFAEDLLRQCASTAREFRLFSNNKNITDRIRSPEISMFASAVSARPVVRRYLLDLQRDMGAGKGVVFEGRDMGTVVFPGADIKFFLDASPQTRALRRYKELSPKSSMTIEEIEQDINHRDENDRTRSLSPLKPAEDAIIVDSTGLSADEVVELMLSHIAENTG